MKMDSELVTNLYQFLEQNPDNILARELLLQQWIHKGDHGEHPHRERQLSETNTLRQRWRLQLRAIFSGKIFQIQWRDSILTGRLRSMRKPPKRIAVIEYLL